MAKQIVTVSAKSVIKARKSESASAKEFEDSADATDHVETIGTMLADKRLKAWSKVTDQNFSAKTLPLLNAAIKAFDAYTTALENASE